MQINLSTPDTAFSRDVPGRYVCNTFDEMLVTIDPGFRAAAGLPARGDLRPFDYVVIGGGTFGAAVAEHLWYRSRGRSERILVLEGGPFLLPEHVQNIPALGLDAGAARKDHLPHREVWGLAWNSVHAFPGLAYCIGGRSVYWGGWSPRPLADEMPSALCPQAVLDDLVPSTLPDGRKGYFRQASDQIGVTETNDFIFGELHRVVRQQVFESLEDGEVGEAMDLGELPDHPALEYRGDPASLPDLAELLGIELPDPLPSGPDLEELKRRLRNLTKLEAPLAVQGQAGHAGFFPFNKFSTVPLLIKAAREASSQSGGDDVKKRLMIVPRCHVVRLNTTSDAGGLRVTEIVTEYALRTGPDWRPPILVSPDTRVIVALGTVESARLALLSFGSDGKIGRNLIAHLRSNMTIRVPREALAGLSPVARGLEASALLVKGRHQFKKPDGSDDGVGYFHFQITASGLGAGGTDSEAELFKKIPDIDTFDAHKQATDTHVVITIRGIGEMEPKPDSDFGNSVTLDMNSQQDDEFQARRAWVNLQPSQRDSELWNAMDAASDDLAHVLGGGLEFEVFTPQGIKRAMPASGTQPRTDLKTLLFYAPNDDPDPAKKGRRDGLGTTHHEAGTLRMGTSGNFSVTDANCRFHAVSNAYVAGPAVFPTVGSPNPMLTGIALARRLGDHLIPPPPPARPEPGFEYLFDGSEDPQILFSDWQMAGPGRFELIHRALVAKPGLGIGLLFYAARQFDDFVLRLDFYLPHPHGGGNDNSGVFVRFRDPRKAVPPGFPPPDVPGNPASVAVDTGYEVQIDEEARGDTRRGEPDGLPFNRTGAIYKVTNLGTAPGQQDFKNNQWLATGRWHSYEIEVTGRTYTVRLNGLDSTRYVADPAEQFRGKPSSEDADSGYIGIQSHTGNIAFANIRIAV